VLEKDEVSDDEWLGRIKFIVKGDGGKVPGDGK
jgi:hypothetical protein